GQNRFGMLFPLLVSWIHNYTANLFAQTELLVRSTIGCIVLFNFCFLHLRLGRAQRLATAMAAMILILCVLSPNVSVVHILALVQPYMPSLFLVLFALAILFRIRAPASIRIVGGFFCLLIALWVNLSTAVLAGGLILCLQIDHADRPTRLRVAAFIALAGA